MREVFHIFLSIPGGAKWRVLLSVLLANLCEGVGLMAMLPVLERVAGDGGPPSALQDAMFRALDVLGIPQDIEILLLFVVLGMVLKGILMVFAMRSVGRAVADVATGLRKDLIDGILRARWSWFTHQPIGRIANAISVDASRAGDAFRLATLFVAAILQAVVYIGLSVFASWQLALCALCVGLAILYVLRPLVSVTKRSGRVQRQKTEELVTLMTDALGNIKPLKAMARQANLLRFVDKKIHSLRKEMRRAAVYKQVMKSLQELIMAMLVAGGFYVAYTFLDASASEIVFAAFLLQKTVKAINTIQEQQQEAALVESAFFAVRDAVAHARSHEERLPAGAEPALEEGIRFEDVSFAFDDRPVLDRISLEIPARQLTVITGASGAGKTTITDLLLGLHEPTGGRILIDDQPLPSLDLHAWRRLVGYVPQELTLFHDTVLANVTFGDPQIPEQQAIEALRTAGAWEFVSDLPDGIHTTVGERGSRFSGGQRQRISLARALVFHPKLLILDEVTSALDPETEAEVCRNVLDISRSHTVVAITHRALWTDAADRVYHLDARGVELVSVD